MDNAVTFVGFKHQMDEKERGLQKMYSTKQNVVYSKEGGKRLKEERFPFKAVQYSEALVIS